MLPWTAKYQNSNDLLAGMEPGRNSYYSGQRKIIEIQGKGGLAGSHFNIETQLNVKVPL